MPEIGYASLGIIPSFKGFQGELERGSSKGLTAAGVSGGTKFGDAAGKSAGSRFGSVFKNAAKAGILAGLGGLALGGKILADSIGSASDLNETVSKTQQIFGKQGATRLVEFAGTADKALGQTKQQALDAAATFGVFGKSAGLEGGKLVKFSSRLSTLASDMASFSNTSPDQAIEAIGAALRGESEPIRAYGVLLDDATLKAEALRLGLLKPVKDKSKILSAQARLTASQAKYNEAVSGASKIQKDLAKARVGSAQATYNKAVKDGGKNSAAAASAQARLADARKKYNDLLAGGGKDSLAAITAQAQLGAAQSALKKATEGTIPPLTQQQKVLAAQSSIFKQTKDQQGDFTRTSGGLANQQRILAARFENTKAALGKGLLPIATDLVTFLNDKGVPALEKFSDWFTSKGVPAIKRFEAKAEPFVKGVLSDTRDVLKDIAPHAKRVVDYFNSLPAGLKKGLGAAAVLGLAGSKIPGGKAAAGAAGGAAKGILGLVTKTKPLPVYVVNNGVGGDVGIGGKGGRGAAIGRGSKALGGLGLGAPAAAVVAGGALFYEMPRARRENEAYRRSHPEPITGPLDGYFGKVQKAVSTSDMFGRGVLGTYVDAATTKTRSLNNEVKLIGSNAKASQAQIRALLGELSRTEQRAIRVQQAVSTARSSKVDGQLGRGGMYVENMHVRGTDLPEVRRDAQHQARARAMGSESFR